MREKSRTVLEIANNVLEVLKDFIGVNTLFVATNDGLNNTIIRAYNRDEILVEEGSILPLHKTYCSLVFESDSGSVTISDTMKDPLSSVMPITQVLGSASFIGFPIKVSNNPAYGTLCVMDRKKREYSQSELSLLQSMAEMISYVAEIENHAFIDSLTGCYNRHFLERYELKHPSAILFIDVDNFKQVNDVYGHQCGDQVLVEIADRTRKVLKSKDILIRYGGDEFIIIMDRIDVENDVDRLAQSLLDEFKLPVFVQEYEINVSLSVGCSILNDNLSSIYSVIREADTAMYEIKESGKGSYKVHHRQV
ncbi:sensor domain-containing diguanylate cyclase [Paenibacillus abyssi]|uniref:GGDEF domain-containing protein n=1 Tax=Paenibacillus abyssi TaxID=1340531 RepID=A0A917G5C8_9BACL|nr:sensor domain-containing diguanylate cyclase [Paenibacillus abyssi]GGG23963.1 hypothetical protein GCM10010916_45640 [Paenibacillus abyssi]